MFQSTPPPALLRQRPPHAPQPPPKPPLTTAVPLNRPRRRRPARPAARSLAVPLRLSSSSDPFCHHHLSPSSVPPPLSSTPDPRVWTSRPRLNPHSDPPDTTRAASSSTCPTQRDNPPVADDALSARPPAPRDLSHRVSVALDAQGRLPPGSVPGWGLSCWLHERGLLGGWEDLPMQTRLDRLNDY